MKKLILLLNIGTPDNPSVPAVRRYLTQFLSDPRVLNIPAVLRWLLVRCVIVPFRSAKSAHAYQKIWTERGSPLLFHSEDLARKLRRAFPDDVVEVAMRYGRPSIQEVLAKHASQVTEIVALPMFPQFSEAATASALAELSKAARVLKVAIPIKSTADFYDLPEFVSAQAELVKAQSEGFKPDHILMSYHGLPKITCKRRTKVAVTA